MANQSAPLNGFTDGHMRELLAYYGPGVEASKENLRSAATDEDRVRIAEFLRTKALNAGLLSFGLGMPNEEVWTFFDHAVGACEVMFQAVSVEKWKNPVALAEGVYLALILGQTPRAGALARLKDYRPEKFDDGRFSADEVVMAFVVALLQYARGDVQAAAETARMAYQQSEPRQEAFAKWFRWHLSALMSAIENNGLAFSDSMAAIAKGHASEARKGRLREDPRGLICISGLALLRIGMTGGHAAPPSPHLPLALLKG